jgi:hypothetical protein
MHTVTIETSDFGAVTINHDGDWHGLATVSWSDQGIKHSVALPAGVLASAISKAAIENLKAVIIVALEEL